VRVAADKINPDHQMVNTKFSAFVNNI